MSRKSPKVAVVPEEALKLLKSLSEQGVLQEALRQIQNMAPSGGASMSDASKRRGDDLSEQDDFQLIREDEKSGGSDQHVQLNEDGVVIRGIKAPDGIDDIETWGRTICTLPKVEKRGASYRELLELAKTSTDMHNYLCWVRKNPQISSKVKDLSDYLKAAGDRMTDEHSGIPFSGYFPGTTEVRFPKDPLAEEKEILFANWAPPCRAVVEAISEWFSVFFLLYRCVLGFAVLNVVNAVFVQQTMKTASSDEDLAFKQKQKDAAVYTRKVKKLFQTMDASGDGAINLEEFAKLVKSPKLKFWMSQLELEYHDLLSLFEFLDNGDGQITLKEFIEGAARLRGGAKALDIWRLETKVEVLFDEILRTLTGPDDSITLTKSVQDVFAHSSYRHMQSAAKVRSENFNSTTPATPTPDGAD